MVPGSNEMGATPTPEVRVAQAEDKAARLEDWFDVAFELSPVAMAIAAAREHRFVRVNQALADFLGRSRESLLATDPFSMMQLITHPDDLAVDEQLVGELAVGRRQSYQIEKRYVRSDGAVRWGLLTVSARHEPAEAGAAAGVGPVGPMRFVAIQILDITEQKETMAALRARDEELRHAQRVESIGRLTSGIAHDFNNLLTVITGHGELLREALEEAPGATTFELRDNLAAILAAAERAGALTTQLLAHGRREAVAPRIFALTDSVGAMQQLLRRVIGSSIETHTDLRAEGAVYADEGQVGQIVMNLVLNARDAMPDGGRLTLATHDVATGATAEDRQAWVALTVSDTGHGMTPEVQARMFEPFFTTRADRPGVQGSGLGLATVQRIVNELRGRIEVQSEPGRGTTVTVSLPRIAETQRSEPPVLPGATASARGERVLVVEDEPLVRALVASVLVGAHYRVAVARDGEEALRFVDEADVPFDVVVTDLMMARVGGHALVAALRARGMAAPVVFISGYRDGPASELAAGSRLLPKPFTPAQLVASVRAALDGVG